MIHIKKKKKKKNTLKKKLVKVGIVTLQNLANATSGPSCILPQLTGKHLAQHTIASR